jgi:plastocyanin
MRRLWIGMLLAAALLAAPAARAEAAVTRAVQAYDTATKSIWTPRVVLAQVGDTVEWRFSQTGNASANGRKHDLWLAAPDGETQQLGASDVGSKASIVVQRAGTYRFYSSLDGGLAVDGMNGWLVVSNTDAGPAVDPGQPWTNPNWVDPYDPAQPLPLANDTLAPTVFEEGDTTAPTVDLISVKETEKAAKVKANVSEAGTLTLRLKKGKKVVATEVVDTNAGDVSAKIKPPKSLRTKQRRYTLQIWATDMAEIDSEIHAIKVDI